MNKIKILLINESEKKINKYNDFIYKEVKNKNWEYLTIFIKIKFWYLLINSQKAPILFQQNECLQ